MTQNIALIGAGYWGKNHLKNLHRLNILHSVLELTDEIVRERRKEFPGVTFLTGDAHILANPDIQGVVIAASAARHFELTKKYLLAGKDVLVEKPLALTTAEGQELVDIAREQNRILMVGHILQYHAAVIKLKELIDAGELGVIRYIYSNRLNIGKLRTEENVLWSFAPHDISLICMLMNGEEPDRVDAHGGAYVKPGIYDTTLTTLEFKNGVKGHVFVSWLHPFKEQKLVVVGSEKMAVFDDVSDKKLSIYPHKINLEGDIPVAMKAESYPVEFEMKEPLREELLHFLHCIDTRETPKTDGVEGLNVLKILERAEIQLNNKR
ncbi:MAG: UDP-2-acetamido-3-amino-2,3-dideoxy-glucuronate N-acetyltransferase [Acidobacteriota bacterium]|nr:UDP-2-acetamido-3-amino-2,3-dideoxy-glucuronate N-acetyltransferase [Acidobacteriota bacterium]